MMETISFFPALLKMIAALAVVLGIMVGLAFLVRRFFPQTGLAASDGSAIRILAVKYLGPKSSIMIVDILGRAVVIGISNQQVSHIMTIDDAASLERLDSLSRQRGGQIMPAGFPGHYKKWVRSFIRPGKENRRQ
ncbi:MAG: flagellar biosynthetic protein FliO [Syntrophales bacterium]|jgi:flagellar protein FliO/FliZ|nr:flagellar biosynthetic protein FliO [Syntrophales bacterium]